MSTIVVAATSSSTASGAITSTKARVVSTVPVQFAVGANPTANNSNCEVISANTVRYINMQGLNNQIAFIAVSGGASGTVSVTPCGTVYASSIVTGNTYIRS